jgi:hypothetical protein
METSSSVNMAEVRIPNYPLAEGDLLHAIEHSGSFHATSTDMEGEYFAMAMARIVPVAEVHLDAIIVIPLTPPIADVELDFTFLAQAKSMFVQLVAKPQTLCTYGLCTAYSAGTSVRPLPVGASFKFPSLAFYIVAQRELATAVRAARGPEVDLTAQVAAEKRQCVRQLGEEGELTDVPGSSKITKGTFTYLLDLNGMKHYTRNKGDLAQREKEFYFLMRAMELDRREYGITYDLVLQAEVYRRMLCEQGDTQSEDRMEIFMSCGLISRVHRISVFSKTEKLKLLLMGSVLMEGSYEPSLNLEDFTTGDKITTGSNPCPNNNIGLISVMKNLQLVLQIVFSDAFGNCLDNFIEDLEGAVRPLELVAADFLRHSVELVLRRCFRIIRSVKSSSLADYSVETPELCAVLFTSSFDKMSYDLSEHHSMMRHDAHYRVQLTRKNEFQARIRHESGAGAKVEKQSVKFAGDIKEEKGAPSPSKICSGHLGKQLSAVRKDGRAYSCGYDKNCTFAHVSITGKSDERLTEIANTMPSPIKSDMVRAINLRKK